MMNKGNYFQNCTAPQQAPVDEWRANTSFEYDRAIHHNPDAAAWAKLFVQTFPRLADKEDLMRAWFANAMMAMHDHLAQKAPVDEREAFEAWAVQNGMHDCTKMANGEYLRDPINICFEAWQARAALKPAVPESIGKQWWLAELDQYGNPDLSDGAHSDRDGAERAFYLINSMGLGVGKQYAVACVTLFKPTGTFVGVNNEDLDTISTMLAAAKDGEA